MRSLRTILTTASALAIGMTGLAAATPALAAGPTTTTPTSCPARSTSAMLLPFGDSNQYFPAPDGGMANPTRTWTGSYAVSPENEPWRVNAVSTRNSLALRNGSWASTPSTCLGAGEDSFRFFYKGTGTPGSRVEVRATIASDTGTYVYRYSLDASTAGWQLSPVLGIPDYSVSHVQQVTLRFSAVTPDDATPVLVDDVLVDPWRGRGW